MSRGGKEETNLTIEQQKDIEIYVLKNQLSNAKNKLLSIIDYLEPLNLSMNVGVMKDDIDLIGHKANLLAHNVAYNLKGRI